MRHVENRKNVRNIMPQIVCLYDYSLPRYHRRKKSRGRKFAEVWSGGPFFIISSSVSRLDLFPSIESFEILFRGKIIVFTFQFIISSFFSCSFVYMYMAYSISSVYPFLTLVSKFRTKWMTV